MEPPFIEETPVHVIQAVKLFITETNIYLKVCEKCSTFKLKVNYRLKTRGSMEGVHDFHEKLALSDFFHHFMIRSKIKHLACIIIYN